LVLSRARLAEVFTTEAQRARRLTEENNQLLLYSVVFSVPSVPLW